MATPQQSDPNKDYHWLVTPDAYLATALILCQKIPYWGLSENITGGGDVFSGLNFRSHHPNYEFIFPIVFNLKHGVELYLKALGCVNHGTYLRMHDLKELFDFVIDQADSRVKPILQKLKDEIWDTIKKYYFGTYIPKITTEDKPDVRNDAERYPEGSAYDIPGPYEWVTGDVIDQISKDIQFLEKKFAQAKRDVLPLI